MMCLCIMHTVFPIPHATYALVLEGEGVSGENTAELAGGEQDQMCTMT